MIQKLITTAAGVALAAAFSACSQSETPAAEGEVTEAQLEEALSDFNSAVDEVAGDIQKTVEEAAASITDTNAEDALKELEQQIEGGN